MYAEVANKFMYRYFTWFSKDHWIVETYCIFIQSFTDIPETVSLKNSESSYVLAYWVNINHDEKRPDLKFVGGRPFDLTKEEMVDFMDLAKCGQQEIEKILNDFDEDN